MGHSKSGSLWILLSLPLLIAATALMDEEIPALIEKLGDRSWKVREAAEEKLISLAEQAREALEAALDHEDAEIRWRVEKLLGQLRWKVSGEHAEKVGDLFENYEDLGVDERIYVVEQVVDRLGPDGVDLLLRMGRQDAEPQVREIALRAARQVGGQSLDDRILGALVGEEGSWAYRWMAEIHDGRGQTKEALDACQKAFRMDPHYPEFNALFCGLLMKEKRWEEAASVLERMKGDDPDNPLYPVLLGRTYKELDRVEEARDEFEAAVAMEPEDLPAYVTLVEQCIEMEMYELALRFIKNSESSNPGAPGIQALQLRIHMARKEWDAAFRVCFYLYQSGGDPALPDAPNPWKESLREILQQRGEGDLATEEFFDEIQDGQVPVGLWESLGRIYREKGLPKYATEELRRVLIFKRKDLDLLVKLAEAAHETGEREQTREAARRALDQGEDLAPSLRRRLEALRDGSAPEAPPRGMPPVLWEWKAKEGDRWARVPDRHGWRIPPVGVGATIVSPVYGSDAIIGIDASSGRRTWRVDPPDPPEPPPSKEALLDLAWITADDGVAYALYNVWQFLPGKFRVTHRQTGLSGIAVDVTSGEILRRFETEVGIGGEPSNTSGAGKIAFPHGVGLSGGKVAFLDLREGRHLWSRSVRRLADIPLRIAGGRVWLALQGGALVGLDTATGERKARVELGSSLTTAPAARDGGIFVPTSKGQILRLQEDGEEAQWSASVREIVSGLALLPGDRLIAAHHGGAVTCWALEAGDVIWEASPGRAAVRAFAGTEATILALNGGRNSFWDEQGEVIAFDPANGAIRWRHGAGLNASLILAGDRAILAEGDLKKLFRLTAFSAGAGPPGDKEIARALQIEARTRAAEGERTVAEALLQRAISLSEIPLYYLELARVYKALRQYERAGEAYLKGSALEGADLEAFGTFQKELDEAMEARKEARKAMEEETERILEQQRRGALEEGEKGGEKGEEGRKERREPPEEGLPARIGTGAIERSDR